MKLFLLFFIPLFSYAGKSIGPYQNELKLLNSIKVNSCDFKETQWLQALMLNTSFNHHFKYSKGCDLQGKFSSRPNAFFPLNLNIKINSTDEKVTAKVRYQLSLTDTPIITLELKDLKSKNLKRIKKAQFKFKYVLKDKKLKVFEGSINGNSIPASSLN